MAFGLILGPGFVSGSTQPVLELWGNGDTVRLEVTGSAAQ